MEFRGDPDRALVIDRGIAHIFDQLTGMVTLNQARLYFDWANPDFDPNIDVINVLRGTPVQAFPTVTINRFKAPHWLCRLILKAQRIQLRSGINTHHPFRFKANGRKFTLIPEKGAGKLAPYDYTSDKEMINQ